MTAWLYALAAMGLMGAFDTIVFHELVARLPHRIAAQRELQLHAARDAVYLGLFLTLAWSEPHGLLVLVLGALLLGEIVISLADFIVEDHSRALSAGERSLHAVMLITYGIFLALIFPVLVPWYQAPTGVVVTSHGWLSWVLTAFALGVLFFGMRDTIAAGRLARRLSDSAEA